MASGEQFDSWGERWMRVFWRKPADGVGERTRRRVTVHLVPFLFFLYILAYLDRVNVSVAELAMHEPESKGGLGLSHGVIGFAFGIFFWGYWILEIPSTLSVLRWGARWVFVRILILWGICAALIGSIGTPFAATMFGWLPHLSVNPDASSNVAIFLSDAAKFINELPTNAKYQFYVLRFLLGFFEGGFFPSVIVYLTLWFRTEDRGKAIASFMIAIPLSSAVGNPISSLLLGVHWFELAGWRWIFITEGILPILAGFATIFFLPDRPHKAKWLPDAEREWLVGELDREHASKQGHGHWAWVHHLGIVLLLTGVYFCLNVTSYGLSSFMPAIIKSQSGVSKQMAGYLSTLPYLMAFAAMMINGWHSDKTGERIWHVAIPLTLLSGAIYLAILLDGTGMVAVGVMIVCVGTFMYSHLPAFWPIPSLFLGAATAASAIGFINMVGNLGGSVGPTIVGQTVDKDISWIEDLVAENNTKEAPDAAQANDLAKSIARLKTAEEAWQFLRTEDGMPDDSIHTRNQSHLCRIAKSLEDSGKLSATDSRRAVQLLSRVALRLPLDETDWDDLKRLLSQGASFSSALKMIAPFPIIAALIILAVSYFRRRSLRNKAAVAA